MAGIAYRTTVQSIVANTWVNVPFQTCFTAPGSPSLWDGYAAFVVPESDWYVLSASIAFEAGTGDCYQGFHIYVNTGYALYSGRTYVPSQYSYPITEEFTVYLTAGTGFWMNVTHTASSARNILTGIRNSSLAVARVGA
jgi:hypothetical protein